MSDKVLPNAETLPGNPNTGPEVKPNAETLPGNPPPSNDKRAGLAETRAGNLNSSNPGGASPTGTGRIVGNYRLTKLLGQGGMGAVYQAEHTAIGKKVAVKLLLPQFSQREDILERFFHEAKTVTDIHHENIVDVLDFGKTEQRETYIQMEFLEGQSLASALKSKLQFSPKRIGHIGLQVCSALKAAHAKGVVHRDIKPDNIFLTERVNQSDFFVKVLDFGIAKLVNNEQQQQQERGAVIGTVLYMSPEQAIGAGVDHQTDIYALGVVLFEMACGGPPFMDNDPGKVRRMHITAPPPAPRELNPDLPKALEDVILKCLAKEKKDRYQDMLEVAAALGEATGIDPTPYFLKSSQRGGASNFLGRWWLAIVLGVVFIAGIGALLGSGVLDSVLKDALVENGQDVSNGNTSPTPAPADNTPSPTPAPKPPASANKVTLQVESTPTGATIVNEATGEVLGKTNMAITVPDGTNILIKLAGYEDTGKYQLTEKLQKLGQSIKHTFKKKIK